MTDQDKATFREVTEIVDDLKTWLDGKFSDIQRHYRATATCDERHKAIDSELAFYKKLTTGSILAAIGAIATHFIK